MQSVWNAAAKSQHMGMQAKLPVIDGLSCLHNTFPLAFDFWDLPWQYCVVICHFHSQADATFEHPPCA